MTVVGSRCKWHTTYKRETANYSKNQANKIIDKISPYAAYSPPTLLLFTSFYSSGLSTLMPISVIPVSWLTLTTILLLLRLPSFCLTRRRVWKSLRFGTW